VAEFRKSGKKGVIANILGRLVCFLSGCVSTCGLTHPFKAGINPVLFMPIYAAGKAFLIHLSRCMADLAAQIRVNAGWFSLLILLLANSADRIFSLPSEDINSEEIDPTAYGLGSLVSRALPTSCRTT